MPDPIGVHALHALIKIHVKPFSKLFKGHYCLELLKCITKTDFFFVTAQVSGSDSSSDVLHKKICIRETNVNPTLVERAEDGDFAGNRELQCYYRCYYLESGFINNSGEIQTDVIKSKIPQKVDKKTAQQAIDKCKRVKGMDSCETAYQMQKCLYNNNLKL